MIKYKTKGVLIHMAIVEDYYNGACHVIIHDDCCKDKTKEEIEATLKRIGEISYLNKVRIALAQQEKENN